VSVCRHEGSGNVEHAPTLLNDGANVHVFGDVSLEDVRPVGRSGKLGEDFVQACLQLAGRAASQGEGDVGAEALDVGVNVLEDKTAGVAGGAVHDEAVRTLAFADRFAKVQPEEITQLVLLEGHPVLVEDLEIPLEEVCAQPLPHIFLRQKAIEELVRDNHVLRARRRHVERHLPCRRVEQAGWGCLHLLPATKMKGKDSRYSSEQKREFNRHK